MRAQNQLRLRTLYTNDPNIYVVLSDHVTNSTYVRHKCCTVLMCHSLDDGKTLGVWSRASAFTCSTRINKTGCHWASRGKEMTSCARSGHAQPEGSLEQPEGNPGQ